MKITRLELHLIRVPFDMGAAPTAFAGMNLTSVDSLFVRVCTDADVEGWGEGWGHVACPTTSAALTTLVGPAFIGRDVSDRSRLMTEMSHRFHIHGRMGPVVYALSAIEIALWDIAGKLASLPIASLLGGAPRDLTAYASLLRYAEPELVASAVERALSQGFRHIKLHEVRLDTVAAARAACGESVWLALDTNCPWTVSQSIEHARALEASRLAWLEEPCGRRKTTPAWRVCAPRRRFRSPRERMPSADTTWQQCYGLDRSTSVSPALSRLAASRRWHRRRSWRARIASTTCRTVSTSDRAS